MNTKERFAATFSFRPVDRPMLDYQGEAETDAAMKRFFGTDDLDVVLKSLNVEFRRILPRYVGPSLHQFADGSTQDEWGIVRRPIHTATGIYMEPCNYPWAQMKSVDEVEAYSWPDPAWYDFSYFPKLCGKYADKVVIFGRAAIMDLINGTSFGRGSEQVLLDIATRDQVALALFEKRFNFWLEFAKRGLQAGGGKIDILYIGEDLGSQNGLLISPTVWEELFRPYMQKMIDLAHSFGARVMMHSCGSVAALIPRFIEIGLDALQALQPRAADMAPENLAKRFGGRIVFDGTMDIQGTLPFGSEEDVRREVRHRKEVFRKCGGFILGPCHKIQSDTPVANILALYDEGGAA